MNDRELLELLLKKVTSVETDLVDIKKDIKSVGEQTAILTEFREETNTRLDGLETGFNGLNTKFDGLQTDFNGLEAKFDRFEEKFDDLEANNANRHLDFQKELRDIKYSIARLEMNTAENWRDIARLKLIRKNKVK